MRQKSDIFPAMKIILSSLLCLAFVFGLSAQTVLLKTTKKYGRDDSTNQLAEFTIRNDGDVKAEIYADDDNSGRFIEFDCLVDGTSFTYVKFPMSKFGSVTFRPRCGRFAILTNVFGTYHITVQEVE